MWWVHNVKLIYFSYFFFLVSVSRYLLVWCLVCLFCCCFYIAVIMEAGGDEEFADGQNIQSSNADVCPSEPRDERSNGTCASYVLLTSCIFFLFLFFCVWLSRCGSSDFGLCLQRTWMWMKRVCLNTPPLWPTSSVGMRLQYARQH